MHRLRVAVWPRDSFTGHGQAAVWTALGIVLVALWLYAPAGRSLMGSDEGRYASLAFGMYRSGDWLTPRLNGILYFEKPPLQYWAGALSFHLFGLNAFAARLWPGLAGLATVGLVAYTAGRLWDRRTGVVALLIAASMTWINVNSHFLSLDAGLCAALTLTMSGLLIAERSGLTTPQAGNWLLAAWFGLALGILSKGLVAIVIPGATLFIQSLWRRDFSIWRQLRWFPGLCVVLVVAVPWFVILSLLHPEFARFFFIHEHFDRFLSTSHHRTGQWWYFLPILLAGALPWTAALPWLLRPRRDDFATSFLFVWSAFVFVFFSLSESKLPSYILPMFPALALLAAKAFENGSRRALVAILALPTILWAAALVLLPQLARFFSAQTPAPAIHSLQVGVGIGAVLFLLAAVIAFRLLLRERRIEALAVVAVAHLCSTLAVMQSHDVFGQLKSSEPIARVLLPRLDAATPVFAVRAYDQTLPFYLRRPVTLVDYVDEFDFGERLEPASWMPTVDQFASRWRREERAAAYMTRPTYSLLESRGLPMRVVFEDARRLVVVKP